MIERIRRLKSKEESFAGVHLPRDAAMLKNNQQFLHYLGLTLQGVGLLMFASLFLTFVSRFGDFSDFDRRMQKQATIGFFSMGIIVAGKLLCRAAARSGKYLDWRGDSNPTRPPFTPFTGMKGGDQHALEDDGKLPLGRQPERIVLVKCSRCGETGGEKANFCQACGEKL